MTEIKNELHYTVKRWNGDPAADRDKFIGGSDAGTILGLNPYKSAYTLWAEKTGTIETEDISGKLSVWFGTEEEEIVAKRFCLETGKKVRRSKMSYGIEEYPFLQGHVDRLIVGENAGLECKTTGSWNRTNYQGGEIPPAHYAQVQFYMLVTGKPAWYYAVKRDNNQFYHCRVDRDDEYINAMLGKLILFWNDVIQKHQPDIDGSDSTSETISKIYPGDAEETETVSLDDEADQLLETRSELESSMTELKASISEIDNRLKDSIGDAQKAVSRHYNISWVNAKPRETIDAERLRKENKAIYEKYVKKGKPSRRFSIKERKQATEK